MASTLSLSQPIRNANASGANWSSTIVNAGKQDHMIVETRDKSLMWFDNDNYINFASADRTTVACRFQDSNLNTHFTYNSFGHGSLLKDMQDNLIFFNIFYNGYDAKLYGWRFTKPAEGWAAWIANPSRSALPTSTQLFDFNWYYGWNDSNNGHNNLSGFHVARAANIPNGVLYIAMSATANGYNNVNNTTDQVGWTINLTTGAMITHGGYDPNRAAYYPYRPNSTNANYIFGNTDYARGIAAMQPFQPHSSQGVRTAWYTNGQNFSYYQSDGYSNRNGNYYQPCYSKWSIDANGVLTTQNGYSTSSAQYWGTLRTVDFEAASGAVSVFASTTTHGPLTRTNNTFDGTNWSYNNSWYGDNVGNDIVTCTIFNGKPTLNTMQGYYDTTVGSWRPNNWTYASTPTNWVFTPKTAPSISWISPTVLRMIASNGTDGAYMDITWDGTNFTFPATATALPGLNTNNPMLSPGSSLLDKYSTFGQGINTAIVESTPLSANGYNYSAFGSIPEPYVSVLKANNGMKFQYQSSATANDANAARFGTDANYLAGPWSTFQFRRVSSGNGTEYYNYTTNAWTSSVVNNAASLFPSGGGACPPYLSTSYYLNDIQGTWADNTSYTYSYVFTDPNGVTKETASKTIATPAVSANPTSPTPRRIFVQTLQNRTSSHVLSVENRILINKINMVNQSANSVGVTLNLGGYNFLSTVTLAPYQTAQFETAVIANPAERLLVTCTADASVDMWIMGTEGV